VHKDELTWTLGALRKARADFFLVRGRAGLKQSKGDGRGKLLEKRKKKNKKGK
jgi:hypothetical protein